MTQIAHKTASAGSMLESYTYTMDKAGLIDEIDQADGSYWTYDYDTRYRLTTAVRHNANDTIHANYAYTYDDGDNQVTKVEPWVDDFTDGSLSGDWNGSSGTDWPVTAGEARNVVGGSSRLMWKTNSDASNELRFPHILLEAGISGSEISRG